MPALDAKDLAHRASGLSTAIIEYFIAHGNACTVKELALHMQRSESYIRTVLAECNGCPPNCVIARHEPRLLRPTMTHLRSMIIALRTGK